MPCDFGPIISNVGLMPGDLSPIISDLGLLPTYILLGAHLNKTFTFSSYIEITSNIVIKSIVCIYRDAITN